MSRSISQDLRCRVVRVHLRSENSYRGLAARFDIGVASVVRILRLHRTTGSVAAKPFRGGRAAQVGPEKGKVLLALVRQHPDATVAELARHYNQKQGSSLSRSTMLRALHRFGFTFRKSLIRAGTLPAGCR